MFTLKIFFVPIGPWKCLAVWNFVAILVCIFNIILFLHGLGSIIFIMAVVPDMFKNYHKWLKNVNLKKLRERYSNFTSAYFGCMGDHQCRPLRSFSCKDKVILRVLICSVLFRMYCIVSISNRSTKLLHYLLGDRTWRCLLIHWQARVDFTRSLSNFAVMKEISDVWNLHLFYHHAMRSFLKVGWEIFASSSSPSSIINYTISLIIVFSTQLHVYRHTWVNVRTVRRCVTCTSERNKLFSSKYAWLDLRF